MLICQTYVCCCHIIMSVALMSFAKNIVCCMDIFCNCQCIFNSSNIKTEVWWNFCFQTLLKKVQHLWKITTQSCTCYKSTTSTKCKAYYGVFPAITANCGPGYKTVGDQCVECGLGEYQEESFQPDCDTCASGYTTTQTQSTSEQDCISKWKLSLKKQQFKHYEKYNSFSSCSYL